VPVQLVGYLVDVHLHCMENLMLEIISEGNISSKIPDHKDSKLVEYAIEIYDSITYFKN
jgi:hypothetical protein